MTPRRNPRRERERGVVLLLTLLVLAIIMIVVAEMNYTVSIDYQLAENSTNSLRSRLAVQSLVETMRPILDATQATGPGENSGPGPGSGPAPAPTGETFSRDQVWGLWAPELRDRNTAEGEEDKLEEQPGLGMEDIWFQVGQDSHPLQVNDVTVSCLIVDEASMIPLSWLKQGGPGGSTAPGSQNRKLFQEALFDEFIKFLQGKRDKNAPPGQTLEPKAIRDRFSAWMNSRQGSKLVTSGGKGGLVESDFALVQGISRDLLFGKKTAENQEIKIQPGLLPYVSLFAPDKINLNTASYPVLKAAFTALSTLKFPVTAPPQVPNPTEVLLLPQGKDKKILEEIRKKQVDSATAGHFSKLEDVASFQNLTSANPFDPKAKNEGDDQHPNWALEKVAVSKILEEVFSCTTTAVSLYCIAKSSGNSEYRVRVVMAKGKKGYEAILWIPFSQ